MGYYRLWVFTGMGYNRFDCITKRRRFSKGATRNQEKSKKQRPTRNNSFEDNLTRRLSAHSQCQFWARSLRYLCNLQNGKEATKPTRVMQHGREREENNEKEKATKRMRWSKCPNCNVHPHPNLYTPSSLLISPTWIFFFRSLLGQFSGLRCQSTLMRSYKRLLKKEYPSGKTSLENLQKVSEIILNVG